MHSWVAPYLFCFRCAKAAFFEYDTPQLTLHETCEDQFGERGHHHYQLGAQLDHINGKITLQHAPAGTVGAVGASSLVDEYKIQDGVASKDLHAGDEVDFTAAQIGGVLTITKIQKK